MKIKRKLIGSLTTATVLIPTLMSATSCTFTKSDPEDPEVPEPTPKEQYACPTVSFNGNAIMSPDAGVKTVKLEGFTLSRGLYKNETVKVSVVTGNGELALRAIPTYQSGQTDMPITFTITVPSDYENAQVIFTLTFDFTYKNETKSYTGLKQQFVYNYARQWQPNRVFGSLGEYEAHLIQPDTPNEKIQFVVDNLILERELKAIDNEDITITPSENIEFVSKSITKVGDDVKLSITLNLLNVDKYDDFTDDDFSLTFAFYANGELKGTSQTLKNGIVNYYRVYQEASVEYSGPTEIYGNPGQTQVSLSNAFSYTRTLKEDFGEHVEFEVQDNSGNPIDQNIFKFNYYADALSITNTSFQYLPQGDQQYQDFEQEFKIHWKISENPAKTGFENEGDITGLKFIYTPIWHKKQVEELNMSSVADRTFTTLNEGDRSLEIDSYAHSTQTATRGFVVKTKLDDSEKIKVALDSTSAQFLNITEQPLIQEFNHTNDEIWTYINITVGFKDEVIEGHTTDTNISQAFDLTFTFEKNDFSFVQEPLTGYTLKYNPFPEEPAEHVDVILKNRYSDAAAVTVFHLDGSLDKQLGDNTLFDVQVQGYDPTVDNHPLEVVHDTVATGDYYKGAKISGTSLDLYFKIDLTLLGYRADEPKDIEVTIDFTFIDKDGTPYTKSKPTIIHYTPFSDSLNDYIEARTVPICLYYQESGGYSREYVTAWIAGDATPTDETDYKYWIVTSWQNKNIYQDLLDTHSESDESFRLGISDFSFKSKYSYASGGTTITEDGCQYLNNYMYCKPSAITWQDQSNFIYSVGSGWTMGRGCDIFVGQIDFSESFYDYEGKEVNKPEWQAAYFNKLKQLNNFQKTYKCINDFIETPITTSAGFNDYSDYATGGFTSRQREDWVDVDYKKADGRWTVNQWKCQNVTPSTMNYQSSSSFTDSYKIHLVNKSGYANDVIVGGPMYYSSTKWTLGASSTLGDYENESVFGGMFVAKKKSVGSIDESKFKLAGIYIGYGSRSTNFTPYFNCFSDGETNLLKEYLAKVS